MRTFKAIFAGVATLWLSAAPATTSAPAALADETLVNQTTAGPQGFAKVARDGDGDYVVVWAGSGSGDANGIYARLYDASGNPRGAEFRVNTTTTDYQTSPDVAMNPAGDFVVVWASNASGNYDVYDRIYDADGTPRIAGSARTNTYAASDQTAPSVAMDAAGNYVVAWQGEGTGDALGIYAQRVTSTGAFAGGEFRVNTTTTGPQVSPAVASDANGNFIVVWTDLGKEGSDGSGIYSQRYFSAGTANGGEVHVNTSTAGNQEAPDVAMDADGDYVVAWYTDDGVNPPDAVYSQWLSTGVNQVGDVIVNDASPADSARSPSVAMSAGGVFAIAWAAFPVNTNEDIRFELHAADRSQIGVNPYEAVSQASDTPQSGASVAMDADGDVVVVWTSSGQDGDGSGVYARRYSGPEDTDVTVALSDSPDPVSRNGAMTYTALVTNQHGAAPQLGSPNIDAAYAGIGTASGISATFTLPTGASAISGAGTNWSCTGSLTLACSFSGKLAPGASSTVTVSLTAQASGGSGNAGVVVDSGQFDSMQANNVDSESTTVNPQPDVTPEAFAFTDQAGVERSTQITSAAVTITGIEQAVAISVAGGSYSVGCTTSYTASAGTVGNGQTVCVRHTSSSGFTTAVNTLLTVGGVSDTFTSTTRAADTTPDAFAFTDQGGVEPSAAVTSSIVTIGGLEQAAAISVAGGEYSIGCTGTFTASAGTISNGQSVCVRQTASASFSTPTDAVLTVGGVADTFTVTTRPPITTPGVFSFSDQDDVAPSTMITSDTLTPSGIEAAAPVSVTGGEYSIGCTGSFTAASGSIAPGESVCLRLTSSASPATTSSATLTIGGVSDTWNVTTAAAPASAGGGGGPMSPGLLAVLALLSFGRMRARRHA